MKAKAAVVFDWENWWAMEDAQGPRNNGLYYKETVKKCYRALRRYGLDVDIVDMEQSIEGYQVVAAPMTYLFRCGFEEKVRSFVGQGGILVMTYWSGIVDGTDLCYLGGTPHGLLDVLGLRMEEIDGLYDFEENEGVPVPGNGLGLEKKYQAKHLCELVRLQGAVPLMTYGKEFYAGKPVLTQNSYGKGTAYYVAADMETAFYEDTFRNILEKHGIEPLLPGVKLPEGVGVSSRETDNAKFLFLQNFSGGDVKGPLPENAEILQGSKDGTLKNLETKILIL